MSTDRRALAAWDGEKYLSLTTFRRDGTPVATPLWFALDGDRLYVATGAQSGKVKRIRNRAEVTVAPCDGRGRVHGEEIAARARILADDDDDVRRVHELLDRKYGFVRRVLTFGAALLDRVRRRRREEVCLELELELDERAAGPSS